MEKQTEDIRMIMCDIDSTILPPGRTEISPRLKEDFRKAEEKGIPVIIDSGRHYTFLPPSLFRDLKMDYIITINGACVVKRDGTVVEKHPMTEETMNKITDLCVQHQIGLGFKFEDRIVTYANHDTFVEGYVGWNSPMAKEIVNNDEKRDHHLTHGYPLGTFLIGSEEIVEPFVHSIPELTFAWSHRRGYDVFLKSITKATGADVILKHYGVEWKNVIAFGDAGNDTAFIQEAGIGVAMNNAHDDVKEHADIIAPDCSDDGVAQILEDLKIV